MHESVDVAGIVGVFRNECVCGGEHGFVGDEKEGHCNGA